MAQLQADNYLGLHGPNSVPRERFCHHCGSPLALFARFCGECGAQGLNTGPKSVVNFASVQQFPGMNLASAPSTEGPQSFQFPYSNQRAFEHSADSWSVPQQQKAPRFATVAPQLQHSDPAIQADLARQTVLLARERLFLYLYCGIFLLVNLFGFWLSLKAYNEYIADELTRSIIALTPLLFINAVGLVCLSPIKNTKRQIATLKEKIKYLRIQVEYKNVM